MSGRSPASRRGPRVRRVLVAAGVVAAAIATTPLGATPASAHVTVDPSSTEPGSYSVLTFRVPTESQTARTVSLTVRLPTDAPFTSVRTEPVPGWTAKVTTTRLASPVQDDDGDEITTAPTEVTWAATGQGLGPGEFGEFRLSVGPLPSTGTVHLPAVQRYSDGTEVDWVQQAQDGAEPEHPAPGVTIHAAAASASPAPDDDGSGGAWPLALSVAALVVALGAAGVATVAARGLRRRTWGP